MAQRLKEEDLRLNIIVNGDKGRKEIADLEASAKKASRSLRELTAQAKAMEAAGQTGTQAYKDTTAAIKEQRTALQATEQRLSFLRRQMDVNKLTLSELRKNINATAAALRAAVPGTENWRRLNNELQLLRSRQQELQAQSRATGDVLSRLHERLSYAVINLGAAFNVASRAMGMMNRATDAFMEYDEAMTDAMKTTNLTKEEITALSEELAKIDTRTSQNELLALARAGGKLGIEGRDNLLGFVRAADQINVALSEDLGGNAEVAITAIGKMTDIFKLQEIYGVEDAMLKVGSAVNELGMASTANEGYIVDFTQRMAGIAPNANISIDRILGLAATLDKYGQTAEMSSTAIGQMIQAMFRDTATFANIAGMSLTDFSDILNTDVNEAMLRVLGNMRQGGSGLGPIVAAMDQMGLNGQRASQVLGTLADHVDELRTQQELANQAFASGTSLTEEFSVKNNSATAAMEKHQKAIHAQVVEIGEQLLPVMNSVTSLAEVGMGLLSKLVSLLLRNQAVIIGLTAAYITYNAISKAFIAIEKLKVFWSKAHRQELAAELVSMRHASAGTIAFAAAHNLLAGSFRAAGIAARMLIKTLMANPIGLIVGGISIAVGALVGILSRSSATTKEATKALKELNEQTAESISTYTEAKTKIDAERASLEKLKTAALTAAQGSEERAEAIKAINDQYGDYLPALLTEKSTNEEIETALKNVNTQLERKILLQARESAETEVLKQKTDSVKAAVEGLNVLYKKNNKRTMNAEEIKTATEALMDYYEAFQTNEFADRTHESAEFVSTMRELGIVVEKNGFIKLSEAFRDAALNGRQLRAVTDGLYGALSGEPTAGGVATPGGTTATTSVTTTTKEYSVSKWSLSGDENYLKALAALKQQYLDGDIRSQQDYNEAVRQLEIKTLTDRLNTAKLTAEERADIESQLQDKLIARMEAVRKSEEDTLAFIRSQKDKELEEENARYETQKAKYKDNAAALEAAEREHQAKVKQIYLDALNGRLSEYDKQHERERLEMLNTQALEVEAFSGTEEELKALKQRHLEELAQLDMTYIRELQTLLTELMATSSSDELGIAEHILSDEEYMAILAKLQELREKYGAITQEDTGETAEEKTPKRGRRGGSLFGVSDDEWAGFFDKIKEGKFGVEELGTAFTALGGAAQAGFSLASKWADMMAAKEEQQLKEYEKANEEKKSALEKRLNAGLMTEAQYNAEVEKMDAEYDAYQEELQLKQAKRNKQLQLTQAIINTALGVTQALGSTFWPLNLVAAAITAAMGAAEIALISSTPISTGFESGGFIDVQRSQDGKRFNARLSPSARGFISGPTVLVGENGSEYVVPSEALENPTIMPVLNTIEAARRNGTLRSLNFDAVYPMSAAGRDMGGFVASSAGSSSAGQRSSSAGIASVALDTETTRQLIAVMEKLSGKLDEPVTAYVSMLGKNGLVEQQKKYENYKNRGNI